MAALEEAIAVGSEGTAAGPWSHQPSSMPSRIPLIIHIDVAPRN